jgi:diguanylate cyclase (GGDEF)-like protein
MQKPPRLADEAKRLSAVRSLNLLDTPAEERFDRITRLASRVLRAPIAVVSLVDEDRQWFKSAHGLRISETGRDVSFCGHAIVADDPLVVEDTSHDERFQDNPVVVGEPNVRFYAGQPIHAGDGQRVGTICVFDREPRTFTPDDRETLQDLGALVESELQRDLLGQSQSKLISERDAYQRKSLVDDLTRLWNRGAIMDILAQEQSRARRGPPMTVAMVDIDFFKRVNDTYGHPAGDVVLQNVAERIRAGVRDFDAVGRYGGEEFLVVLSNCDAANAWLLAERIRANVSASTIYAGGHELTVTVSIGVAPFRPNLSAEPPVIERADQALYRAKANGRNRVESA